jgi:hypothetical protein
VNVVRIRLLPKGVGEECVVRLGESLALPRECGWGSLRELIVEDDTG